jgi:hypothetical protein
MTKQLLTSVVLVDLTHGIDPSFLSAAASALDQQVRQDLSRLWGGIHARVSAAPSLSALRPGDWPVYIVAKLPPGEGGFHLDKHHQPYAKVIGSAADPSWTVDASHEICEMLVDPFGSRMHPSAAIAIQGGQVVDAPGTFNYLVEACDPCEANNFAYEIQGIAVSDFITPNYYDSQVTPNTLYSCRGHVTRPRQMLEGGYISFINASGAWQQILWVDGPQPTLKTLAAHSALSPREFVHESMGVEATAAKHFQRRKPNGLPEGVLRRVQDMQLQRGATAAAFEAELKERHRL